MNGWPWFLGAMIVVAILLPKDPNIAKIEKRLDRIEMKLEFLEDKLK